MIYISVNKATNSEHFFINGITEDGTTVASENFIDEIKDLTIKNSLISFIDNYINDKNIVITNYDGELDLDLFVNKVVNDNGDTPIQLDYLNMKTEVDALINFIKQFNIL
jgi:hypothetical protein